jgi:hypothetical protein
MRMSRAVALLGLVISVLAPRAASADADKEHKLLMAEIRMLQEQQQEMRQFILGLGETLKAINARLDTDANRNQKSFADQRLIVEGVAETTRVLREKADETNVRLASMTQELQTLRQTVASMPAPAPASTSPTGDPAVGDPSAGSAAPNPPPNVSPTQLWERVYALYTAGQYDLAVAAGRRSAALHRPFALQRRQIRRRRDGAAARDHELPANG